MARTPRKLFASGAAVIIGLLPLTQLAPATAAPLDAVSYGPGTYTLPIPAGACSAQVTVAGASGGNSIAGATATGGAGSIISGVIPARAGTVLDIVVGGAGTDAGAGGANGGGSGGVGTGHPGAGGGGSSRISAGGTTWVVAGGGGGSGGGHSLTLGWGGDAGVPTVVGAIPGSNGQIGEDSPGVPGGGSGGGASAPGAGGVHSVNAAVNGFPGNGSRGGNGGNDPDLDTGGGGGGGYFGGGGGASTSSSGTTGGGGGGGASYVAPAVTAMSAVAGSKASGTNGRVDVEWNLCDYDLSLTKSASAAVFEDGDSVDYALTATSHGPDDMGIGAPVAFADSRLTGATIESASSSSGEPVTCAPGVGQVAPSNSLSCTILASDGTSQRGLDDGESITVTYRQVLSGSEPIANDASVSDTGDPAGNSASVTLVPASPALSLVKAADREKVSAAGESVEYTFTVANTGNIALHGITISEDQFSGSGTLGDITCAESSLDPGAETECTASYVATQADVDAGKLTNEATAHAETPAGNRVASPTSKALVEAEHLPALELRKTVDRDRVTAAGDAVEYTFAVANTGNVTLHRIEIAEGQFSGTGTLGDITCAESSLDPGAETECTASYAVTQADVDAGKLTNEAVAKALTPADLPVESQTSAAMVEAEQLPKLELVKTADRERVTAAGDLVKYTFAATNSGNVTLHDLAIAEDHFSGTGTLGQVTCAETSLAPAATTDCTASYTVTQADLHASPLTNTAHAVATAPNDAKVASEQSTAKVIAVAPAAKPLAPTGAEPGAGWVLSGLVVLLIGLGAVSLHRVRARK